MWIDRFRVQNFSSFEDSHWVALDPKFNLFVGRNNSGKSALLRSLVFPLPDNPHKDPNTFRGTNLKMPLIQVDLLCRASEIFDRMEAKGAKALFPVLDNDVQSINELLAFLNNTEKPVKLEMQRSVGSDLAPRDGGSISQFRNSTSPYCVQVARIGESLTQQGIRQSADNLPEILHENTGSIFHFNAERLNVGRSSLDSPGRLRSDAQNLPAVLARLQGSRRPLFDRIEKHVVDIVGGIEAITVTPVDNMFEILIWPKKDAVFEELSFKLQDSGTGIGQILAVVTAVVTSEQSVIIIDEINSFIHPSAVKKLLHLLRSDYPHHQYIISTHSSDAIASCNAEKMYVIDRMGFSSSVREINISDADQARDVAGHLGFSMMDVFGFERVIWVEGPTEEVCFQYIVRRFELVVGTEFGFASVGSPSELTTKQSKKRSLVDIYERAGKLLAPLLKGMAFALDRERLTDDEVAHQERSKRKLRLLPRRCFECYLLDPEAISTVLSTVGGEKISSHNIEQKMRVLAGLQKYGSPKKWKGDLYDHDWLKQVDAANLLSDLFNNCTDTRVEYRKTRDGISLLRSIADSRPQHLVSLIEFVSKVIDICMRDTKP